MIPKTLLIGTAIVAATLIGSSIFWKSITANAEWKKAPTRKGTPIVVELFTSEG